MPYFLLVYPTLMASYCLMVLSYLLCMVNIACLFPVPPCHCLTLTLPSDTETHPARRRPLRSLPFQSHDIRLPPSNPDTHCSRQAVLRYLRWPAGPFLRLHGSARCRWSRSHSHRAPALQLYHCQRRTEERSVYWMELRYNSSRSCQG